MSNQRTHTTNRQIKHSKNSLEVLVDSLVFKYVYLAFSVLALLTTTVYWAVLSTRVQLSNADELANGDIMGHIHDLSSAILPGQHTFLLKWPLFLLVGALGNTKNAVTLLTVAIALITIGAFAFILYRIERRPLVFGTICLALASMLLLVPAEPYPGGILPINMAMLTTRNIEYICYIISLYFVVRAKKMRSLSFILATLLLSIIIASDKLFLALSAGGAVLSLVVYAIVRRWTLVGFAVRWFICSVLAGLLANFILAVLSGHHVVHIVDSATVTPYGSVTNLHSLELAIIYALLGLFTIFGANPATDTRLLRHIPHQVLHNVCSLEGLALIINLAILAYGIYVICQLLTNTIVRGKHDPESKSHTLALTLTWSSVIAFGSFVVSKHYYPVDARYLQIAFFALFVVIASQLRRRQIQPRFVLLTGIVLTVSIASGLWGAQQNYHADQTALTATNNRDSLIAVALKQHPVSVLVGDYWRVLPTRLDSHNKVQVMPLANCTQPLSILTSTDWQVNLHKHSFAYLLTLDKSLTNFPRCSLQQITNVYGQPNATNIIAGTILKPKELLLFYDNGIHKQTSAIKKVATASPVSSVTPAPLENLPNTTCSGPTDMNIVAHEDDDLLFMNPDVLQSIQAGYCIRTIYVTAGNAGLGKEYWTQRQQGAEAAYSEMTGASTIWDQQYIKLTNDEAITVASPQGDTNISLIFLNLPDGNVNGQGFLSSDFESLAKLNAGHIATITSVDESSTYTLTGLVSALESLMHAYQPTIIRTQATYDTLKAVPEHSDHMAVGQITQLAYAKYETDALDNQVIIPLKFYIGYPIREMTPNVTGNELVQKSAAFFVYAMHDGNVCKNMTQCEQQHSNYALYITRKYSYSSSPS